ncbi:MAG TPA: pyridoxamine 5'-phosphate oxidase [Propionibacteriaceae bacterium]|nr:pyridoxamine 5'-phosphate oxidase [Propionibacteriaceae bacterium]
MREPVEADPAGRDLPDLSRERVEYLGDHLLETAIPPDPLVLFSSWLSEAFAAKDRGVLPEPTAMVVSTTAGGRPSSRTVLLKEVNAGGFVFFTNYRSRKASEMAGSSAVALLFGWYPLQRQVRVEGRAERVARSESEAYFASRPRASQLGAWASSQSSEVTLQELTELYRRADERFAGADVPCPEHWGGYRVRPDSIEFWQGQPSRLHDRLVYRRVHESWEIVRLAP